MRTKNAVTAARSSPMSNKKIDKFITKLESNFDCPDAVIDDYKIPHKCLVKGRESENRKCYKCWNLALRGLFK